MPDQLAPAIRSLSGDKAGHVMTSTSPGTGPVTGDQSRQQPVTGHQGPVRLQVTGPTNRSTETGPVTGPTHQPPVNRDQSGHQSDPPVNGEWSGHRSDPSVNGDRSGHRSDPPVTRDWSGHKSLVRPTGHQSPV